MRPLPPHRTSAPGLGASLRHQRWLGSQEARIAKMKELGLEPITRTADDGPEDIRRAAS
jgi:hypothetical protein